MKERSPYDGTEKPLVNVTGETVGGEMYYELGEDAVNAPSGMGATTSIPNATEIGTYYVWYKVVGDANHNDAAPKCVTSEITKAEQKADVKPVIAAKGIAKGKTSLKFSWTKANGAKTYEIWLSKCGVPIKKVKTLDATKTSFTKKGLKKNASYKFYVIAKDASGKTICKSITGHVLTSNAKGKYTNAKSLKLSASKVTLSKGGSAKIKATQTKAKKGKKLLKHAALLRYMSENKAVATVDSKGNIKAVGEGTCKIFVQTVNGIWKTVTVTVK